MKYAPGEKKKNGAEVVRLAKGSLVGYPPCPHLDYLKVLIEKKLSLDFVEDTYISKKSKKLRETGVYEK